MLLQRHLLRISIRSSFADFARLNGSISRYSTNHKSLLMHPLLEQKAQSLTQEYSALAEEVSNSEHYSADSATKLSRMSRIVEQIKEYEAAKDELQGLEEMLEDPTLRSDAEGEIEEARKILQNRSDALQGQLVPSNVFVDKACILELRPGIGGQEAMIFANDMLEMYMNYAMKHKWETQVVSISRVPGSTGIMEAILSINEPGSYERLQYEGGVHRVQRVPETETKGRVHTSTAAVVVLPQMSNTSGADDSSEDERAFERGEVKIEVMRAGGSGGQHVNRTESAVRLTHIPTGIQVAMQDERSQHKNKAKAFMILRARIAEKERIATEKEERSKRTAQVSSTERSDKIRTYNYPQNRVTDHRCGYSAHNLTETMAGETLDQAIDAMEKFRREELIRELVENS